MGTKFGAAMDSSTARPGVITGYGGGSLNIDDSRATPLDGSAPDRSAPKKRGGLFGSGMDGQEWIDVLTRAAALAQGDYGGAAEIGNGMAKRRATLAERQAAMMQQERLYQALAAKGFTPEDIQIAMTNPEAMGTNFNKRLAPEDAPTPPAFVKNLEAWNQMDDAQKNQVAQMQSVLNPQFMTGADGQSYQRPAAGFDPNEWEPYEPQGGATGSPSPTFRRR